MDILLGLCCSKRVDLLPNRATKVFQKTLMDLAVAIRQKESAHQVQQQQQTTAQQQLTSLQQNIGMLQH